MKRGFTLLELIIVIIVIGILAGLAMPQYFRIVEKARTAEGIQLIGLVRSGQLRYYAEYSAYTSSISALDVENTTAKFFTIRAGNSSASLATASRNANQNPGYGTYNLSINEAGNITCSGGSGGACTKIGY